jgi:predicted nucleotidyltransferase
MTKSQRDSICLYFSAKPVEKGYIFGSPARNEAVAGSDIDLLVRVGEKYDMSLFEFGRMLEDLKDLLKVDVDLVAEDGLSPYLSTYYCG